MTNDKRATTRFPIQAVDFATLRINGDSILLGSITNICQSGLHLDLFPVGPQSAPQPGDCIVMQTCPKGLGRLLKDATGTVTWVKDQSCGILLDTPMRFSADDLRRYFDRANLSPWETMGA